MGEGDCMCVQKIPLVQGSETIHIQLRSIIGKQLQLSS